MKRTYKTTMMLSAFAFFAGVAGNANAYVDLSKSPTGAVKYASEATATNGTYTLTNDATTPAGLLSVRTPLGTALGATAKYIRIELTGCAFKAFAAGDVKIFDPTAATDRGATITLANSVTDGATVAILQATSGTDLSGTDIVVFAPGTITTTSQGAASISYSIHESQSAAGLNTGGLGVATGQYFSWASGLTAACTENASIARIDVTDRTKFEGGSTSEKLFDLNVAPATGVYNPADSTAVDMADYVGAVADASNLIVTGALAAFNTKSSADNESAEVVYTGATAPSTNFTINDANTTATVDVLDIDEAAGNLEGNVSLTPDAVNMSAGSYTASVSLQGGTYTTTALVKDLGTCGTLKNSGSTDRMDFVLTPNGAYTQYVRITNPSGTDGLVMVTVYNDNGESQEFDLADITGAATLAGGASTALININDVYEAAQAAATAAGTSFEANGGKLRVEVNGEFGGDAKDSNQQVFGNVRRADGIVIQGLTISTDGTSFFMTKN